MNDSGELVPVGKVRGRKTSIMKLAALATEAINSCPEKNQLIAISHGDCQADAGYLADIIKNNTGVSDIIINILSPAIVAHSGPGTLAVFFEADER